MESISESLPGDLQINDHDRENPQIHDWRSQKNENSWFIIFQRKLVNYHKYRKEN